jgi:hypothetical protein
MPLLPNSLLLNVYFQKCVLIFCICIWICRLIISCNNKLTTNICLCVSLVINQVYLKPGKFCSQGTSREVVHHFKHSCGTKNWTKISKQLNCSFTSLLVNKKKIGVKIKQASALSHIYHHLFLSSCFMDNLKRDLHEVKSAQTSALKTAPAGAF